MVELEVVADVAEGGQLAGRGRFLGIGRVAAAHFFVIARIACARVGGDVHPAHVLGALARGPQALAGHGAGLATHALVQVDDVADLAGVTQQFFLGRAALCECHGDSSVKDDGLRRW